MAKKSPAKKSPAKKSPPKKSSGKAHPVSLGLQGGGAHGAFTRGVLDRLLEDGRLDIKGISGTSAGAMNGAVLICGLDKGGPEAARELLEDFWRRVSAKWPSPPPLPTGMPAGPFVAGLLGGQYLPGGRGSLDHIPAYQILESMTRVFSPYQFNPGDLHPLRDILEDTLDLDCLQNQTRVDLYVTATNVRTGKARIFQPRELTIDALLASACMPQLYRAVEIDGDPFWDGGYMGNPSILPLIDCEGARDMILVQINPIRTVKTPKSAREIQNRINEISFNASLIHEMRHVDTITRLLDAGHLDPACGARQVYLHMIEAEDVLSGLTYSSKLNAGWEFLVWLRDLGRERAGAWLDGDAAWLGKRATVDVERLFI